jgi:hypothetical protein
MAAMNARAAFAVPGDPQGDETSGLARLQGLLATNKPCAGGDETSELARLAVAMLRLHGSFAQRGARGPRDANDNSVPLVLAVKAATAMLERCE